MPTEEPHTIILLHQQTLLREALARLLAAAPNYRVIAEPADVPALKRALAVERAPDVLLLDVESAQPRLLEWLHQRWPAMAKLVVGPVAETTLSLRLFHHGAQGFCSTRNGHLATLVQQLDCLRAGGLAFTREFNERLRLEARAPVRPIPLEKPLPPRQCEFLQLVATGLGYKQMARAMSVTEHTVYNHRNALCHRFGLKRKAQLVMLAVRLGFAREQA